ncbi:conserved hypothetical protein [Ricinus communis]|uniref:Uncharacterized protein n=1 Tax=Ricinus communis TaxID=3988 RepID=B9S234_RICCO|nr:conserved hypothetical protein [Ricinus communis]
MEWKTVPYHTVVRHVSHQNNRSIPSTTRNGCNRKRTPGTIALCRQHLDKS